MKTSVVEVIEYRFNAQANPEAIELALAQLNDFVKEQPGFIYRSASKTDDNLYFDIVYWETAEAQKLASNVFEQSDFCQRLMALTDETSVKMTISNIVEEALSESLAA